MSFGDSHLPYFNVELRNCLLIFLLSLNSTLSLKYSILIVQCQ